MMTLSVIVGTTFRICGLNGFRRCHSFSVQFGRLNLDPPVKLLKIKWYFCRAKENSHAKFFGQLVF